MTSPTLGSSDLAYVEDLVSHYVDHLPGLRRFAVALYGLFDEDQPLDKFIHSVSWRLKDPGHLRDKLIRKWLKRREAGEELQVTKDNLFEEITDLVGLRILHLHTTQMADINPALMAMLEEAAYPLIEGPTAITWDDESRRFFRDIGISTRDSATLYTSVHYIVQTNARTGYRGEIQVRTLAEELWGEVDHTINYPRPSNSMPCREQIAALARATSSCTRLVDAIFRTHAEFLGSAPSTSAANAAQLSGGEGASSGLSEQPKSSDRAE